jgi:hypothetical protein
LGDYDLDYNLLLVNIKTPHLPVARLDHQVQLASCSKVLAVGRVYNSRKLMATSGLVKDTTSIFDHEEIAVSTCSTIWEYLTKKSTYLDIFSLLYP